MTEQVDFNIDTSRRRFLTGVSVTGVSALLSGCQSSDEELENPYTDNETETESEPEDQPTPEPETTTFTEQYEETFNYGPDRLLSSSEIEEVEMIADTQSISAALEAASGFVESPLGEQAQEDLKFVIHNDLGYSTEEVRLLERRFSDGSAYGAVMIKEGEDWVKDLQAVTGTETGYLRHDEESLDSSRERGISRLWTSGLAAANNFVDIRPHLNFEDATEEDLRDGLEDLDNANDSVVVNEDRDVGEIGFDYDVAEYLEDMQDFHDNDTFNSEMEYVENLTEFYHNELDDGMYVQVGVETGELSDEQYRLTDVNDATIVATQVGEERHEEAREEAYRSDPPQN